MSNLVKRILFSIVFVALILGPLFISTRIAFTVYALLGFFTLNEIHQLVGKTGGQIQKVTSFASYITLVFLVYEILFEEGTHTRLLVLAYAFLTFLTFLIEVFRNNPQPFQNLSATISGPVYIAASFLGIAYFFEYRSDLPVLWLTVSVFTIIWINDAAAYLLGRKIGKRKLYESLSPNKTIEGSLSGLIFGLLTGWGLSYIEGMPSALVMIPFALVVVVSGSLGDLLESRLKRSADVKDSGVFLPGHGGFFDRFDAMMLAIPSSILFFEIVLPKS